MATFSQKSLSPPCTFVPSCGQKRKKGIGHISASNEDRALMFGSHERSLKALSALNWDETYATQDFALQLPWALLLIQGGSNDVLEPGQMSQLLWLKLAYVESQV